MSLSRNFEVLARENLALSHIFDVGASSGNWMFISSFNEEEFKSYAPDGRLIIPEKLFGGRVIGISSEVFANCQSIKEVVLPEGLAHIGSRAFAGCVNLGRFVVPKSLRELGNGAFTGCKNIKFEGGFYEYGIYADRHLATRVSRYNESITINSYLGDEEKIRIPVDLTPFDYACYIGDYAFAGLDCIKRIVIPFWVKRVGNYAFQNCASLKSAILSDEVWKLGNGVFQNCKSLRFVDLSNSIGRIPTATFQNCEELVDVHFPDNLAYIDENAFANCKKLRRKQIPRRIRKEFGDAFGK